MKMNISHKFKRLVYKTAIRGIVRLVQSCCIPSLDDVKVDINVVQDVPVDLYRSSVTFNQVLFGAFTKVHESECVFIDVGVNVGQNLIAHFTNFSDARYVGFDPNPASITVAEHLCIRNGFQALLICAGLSNTSSRMKLVKESSTDSECKVSSSDQRNCDRSLSTIVQTDALDSWSDMFLSLGKHWFVKIDVEGHELQVLQGMCSVMSEIRPVISCEILGGSYIYELDVLRQKAKLIESTLSSHSYDMYLIDLIYYAERSQLRLRRIDEIPVGLYAEMRGITDYLFVPSEYGSQLVYEFLVSEPLE